MQRSLLVTLIIFISLVCTACVNRFAVQELNNNAKDLLSQGKTEAAISRLESSIDLDDSLYETHYNLSVAYIKAKMYDKALNSLKRVIELNPDFAEAYHSLAVCNQEMGYEIITNVNEIEDAVETGNDGIQKKELSQEDKQKVCDYFNEAIDNYDKYLAKKQNADDAEKVNETINTLNNEIRKYNAEKVN